MVLTKLPPFESRDPQTTYRTSWTSVRTNGATDKRVSKALSHWIYGV